MSQNFTGSYAIMGKGQLKKGGPDVVAEFLERAAEMDPSNFEAHFQLGKACEERDRNEDFNREFEPNRELREVARPKLESLR